MQIKKNNIIYIVVIIIVLSGLFYSCNKNKIYEDYQKIKNNVWCKDSVLNFELNIEDTAAVYNVFLNVRHASFYRYSNLWVFAKITRPDFSYAIDTIECILAEDNGRWRGDGLGDIWDYTHDWIKNNSEIFNINGKYKIEIKHAMRDSLTLGIMDIGIEIDKVVYRD